MIRVPAEEVHVGDRVTLSTSVPTVQTNEGGALTFTDGRTMRLGGQMLWVERGDDDATAEAVRVAIGGDVQIALDALGKAAAKLPPLNLYRGGNTDAARLRLIRAVDQLRPLARG